LARLTSALRHESILSARDYAFCLHPASSFEELLEKSRELVS